MEVGRLFKSIESLSSLLDCIDQWTQRMIGVGVGSEKLGWRLDGRWKQGMVKGFRYD